MSKSVSETVHKIIEPIIDNLGIELVEVEFKKEGDQWILRVFIDREGGVGLEDCRLVNRELEPILDVEDPIIHPYTLEVSSPGLERPLKRLSDFQRFKGKPAKIKLYTPMEGKKVFHGHILGTEEEDVLLEEEGETLRISMGKIAKANLEIEW